MAIPLFEIPLRETEYGVSVIASDNVKIDHNTILDMQIWGGTNMNIVMLEFSDYEQRFIDLRTTTLTITPNG